MGWRTTSDLELFTAAAGGYLVSSAAENALVLSAAQAGRPGWPARSVRPARGGQAPAGREPLFGWWEPPAGSGPRGAFVHDPAMPLLIAGRAPEMAAALAGTLAKMGRAVCGVDGPAGAADAFAAAWSQRSGTAVRVHRHCRVYRLAAPAAGVPVDAAPPGASLTGGLRVATDGDRALVADWLARFAAETGERIGEPRDLADDLIGYGGAVLWEVPHRASRLREAAHQLVSAHHRDAGPHAAAASRPAAMAVLSRPAGGLVRIGMVYTPPECRRNGYAVAVTLAASRAALEATPPATGVVLITDANWPDSRVARLGYQLVGERAVLRFGPPTGPQPRLRATGPLPRLPTGPLPRLRPRR